MNCLIAINANRTLHLGTSRERPLHRGADSGAQRNGSMSTKNVPLRTSRLFSTTSHGLDYWTRDRYNYTIRFVSEGDAQSRGRRPPACPRCFRAYQSLQLVLPYVLYPTPLPGHRGHGKGIVGHRMVESRPPSADNGMVFLLLTGGEVFCVATSLRSTSRLLVWDWSLHSSPTARSLRKRSQDVCPGATELHRITLYGATAATYEQLPELRAASRLAARE